MTFGGTQTSTKTNGYQNVKFSKLKNMKRQFVHKICVHNFCAPCPPPPNQQSGGIPLDFLLKGPQAELRTLSQNCEQNPPKFANNQNREQTGVSEKKKTCHFDTHPS